MNKRRRTVLEAVSTALAQGISIIEEVRDEEQEAFDNMPEGLQQGEKGTAMEEGIDALDEIIESIQEAIDKISDVTGG